MRRRSWTNSQLSNAVNSSFSFRQTLSQLLLKPTGGNYKQLHKYISEIGINISHFKGKGWNKGLKTGYLPRIPLENILILGSSFQSHKLKIRLLRAGLKPKHCEECGWAQKSIDGRIPLELDHINGNSSDNRLENLRILCPNCHSLKTSHRGRNIGKKR